MSCIIINLEHLVRNIFLPVFSQNISRFHMVAGHRTSLDDHEISLENLELISHLTCKYTVCKQTCHRGVETMSPVCLSHPLADIIDLFRVHLFRQNIFQHSNPLLEVSLIGFLHLQCLVKQFQERGFLMTVTGKCCCSDKEASKNYYSYLLHCFSISRTNIQKKADDKRHQPFLKV